MLRTTDRGLYCEAGDFFIDPWAPVPRAVVTHAHGDHLTWGCDAYLVSHDGEGVTRERLGRWGSGVESVAYGETRLVNGVTVSLHPAGHILGSAQVRLEHRGEVWVVSGDYKTDPDPTCAPWEPVRCHTFITESTFGLPIYRWPSQRQVFDELNRWWAANAAEGRVSLLCAYALGKAQRLLAGLDPAIGPMLTHGAVERMTALYRHGGVALPLTVHATDALRTRATAGAIVIAPPSVTGSTWLRRFGEVRTAFASGWMRVRGERRRRAVDAGFTLSDHVDWPQLLAAIDATGAERVWVTHGFTGPVVQWLTERGLEARVMATRWEGERDDAAVDAAADDNDGATTVTEVPVVGESTS
ncbi:MAG: ligase-associated DNA damage response exonuclease [Gemmatimonas sp.]|jgi:putative mRNA 3-end processing factor|uniref:ligase-associated DNA damage response exonuclease n=2 Tax=Gemmatimonas sp. TaxID=1962908 RepID=UPI0022C68710|nr:ligase-associated DNA damage response exonuclease [Gemmatimonas sp.]MCE2952605.1 ligase-associated DNA damage response exonuclease [Gemmatimonas sp.]MCZ8010966.1 ligase-associated DNA damage response exonuclease [Gemmatimonas sp.]MCZ8266214.1 ligase-associated DNA damage response exonuclease [Gemmatimonas sp.]